MRDFCGASELLWYVIFNLKINEKRVTLVDYDSWEAEYSLKFFRPLVAMLQALCCP